VKPQVKLLTLAGMKQDKAIHLAVRRLATGKAVLRLDRPIAPRPEAFGKIATLAGVDKLAS
jgi:hypothetical protein